MSEIKHTPGKWDVRGTNGLKIIFGQDGDIAGMRTRANYPSAQREADARLIAAAPQLLGALYQIRDMVDMCCDAQHMSSEERFNILDDVRNSARAAIAKTTGKGGE